MIPHRARLAALAGLALLVAPTLASAQLGGLVKKAKKTAEGEVNKAAAAQVPPPVVDQLPCNLSLDDLEAARKGMEAEVAAAPGAEKEAEQRQKKAESERNAYEKARADYERKSQSWGACQEKVLNDPAAKKQLAALEEKARASGDITYSEEELKALALRAQAAAERTGQGRGTAEDARTMEEFQKAMAKLQGQANAALSANQELSAYQRERQAVFEKTCGAKPEAPRDPGNEGYSAERILQEKGAAAAELPVSKYALIRECAIMASGVRLSSKGGSAETVDLVNKKLDEVQQLTSRMRAAKVPL
ncbi:MAG: hypothetical protein MUC69_02190 [Gemmatimonadales bacterium]|jgi:hypothetical protein|nr:hypothetical protein [Gemmatimonadales bacterium]